MSLQDFDGNWINAGRNETHSISGGILSWFNGSSSPIRLDAPGSINVQSSSGNFSGQLTNGGNQIAWNNGSCWSRNGQQQMVSPTSSAAMVQAAPMQQQPPPTFPSMPPVPQPQPQQYASPPPTAPMIEATPRPQTFQPQPAPMPCTQPAPQPQQMCASPPSSAPVVQAVPQPVPMQYAQPTPQPAPQPVQYTQPASQPVPTPRPAPQPVQYTQPAPQPVPAPQPAVQYTPPPPQPVSAPQPAPQPVQYTQPSPQPVSALQSAPQPVQYTQPAPQPSPAPQPAVQYTPPPPQPVYAPQPAPQPVQYTQPAPQPVPAVQPAPQPVQCTQPAPQPVPAPQLAPQPQQYMQPAPQPVPAPQSAPQPVQYTQPAPQPVSAAQPAPQFAPQPVQCTQPAPQPVPPPQPIPQSVQYTQPASQPVPAQYTQPAPTPQPVQYTPPAFQPTPSTVAPVQYTPPPQQPPPVQYSSPLPSQQTVQAVPNMSYTSMPAPATQVMPQAYQPSQSWQSLPAAAPMSPRPEPVYATPAPQIMPLSVPQPVQTASPLPSQQEVQSVPMPMQCSFPPATQQSVPAVPTYQSMPAPSPQPTALYQEPFAQPVQYSSPPPTQQMVQAAPVPTYASMPATMTYSAPTYSPPAPPPTTITSPAQNYSPPVSQSYASAPVPMTGYCSTQAPTPLPPTSYSASQYVGAPPQTPKGLLDRSRLLELKQIFLKYDTDGSNMLGIDELGHVLEEINMPVGPQGLHMFYENFDVSPDGRISFAEFMAAFHSPQPAYDPPQVAAVAAADGRFVDVQFPPNDSSVWMSNNPAADKADAVRQACGGAMQWVRSNDLCQGGPLFENVHPNDISQPVLGDCWLLGALAGLAEFEGAVFGLFEERRQSPDGRYTMKLYNGTEFEPVVIDDFIPVSAVDGETLFSKPQDNDQWVLLAEKAMAKWMGSYIQCTCAYNLVAFMLLTDSGPCKAFGQSRNGQPPFDSNNYTEMRVTLTDPHVRGSVFLEEQGPASHEVVWQELLTADRMNYIVCAWTLKEVGPVGSNGLVRGKAYAIIGALEVQADGINWRVVHVRNPWASVPGAFWRGQLSDEWAGWGQYPQLAQELGAGNPGLDGTFWMTWDDFRDAFSDIGVVPKTMEVPRLGQIECEAPIPAPNARHGKRFQQ